MSTLSQFFGGNTTLPIPLSPDAFTIDVLIVGGGGASGPAGGGRVVQVFGLLIEKNTVYSVTVGGAGQDSKFGEILAQAGGSGGTSGFAGGEIGGSGGGGVYVSPGGTIGSGGATIFPTIGSYTINGGASACNIVSSGNNGSSAAVLANGAGGGAGSAATNAANITSGIGGSALRSIIKGPGPYLYAAGIPGGVGAGGANTGTGAQSGVVVVAYPNTFALATTIGAPTLFSASNPAGANATRSGYHVYEFTGSGSITFN